MTSWCSQNTRMTGPGEPPGALLRFGAAELTLSMSPERVRNVQRALNDNGSHVAVDG